MFKRLLLTFFSLILFLGLHAQELEPRALTNIPLGTNFVAANYSFMYGNVLFDPVLSYEGVTSTTGALTVAYLHAFDFFGMGAKYNIGFSGVHAYWQGEQYNTDSSLVRVGPADLRVGFSVNVLGSPALTPQEYASYTQKSILGVSFLMVIPTGQYYSNKLINIGANRWAFRPQVGYSFTSDTWIFEGMANIWLFSPNREFANGYTVGNTLRQHPISTFKLNVIKTFKKGSWLALGGGWAEGGRAYVNDEKRSSDVSTLRYGLIYSVPINRHHSLKFSAITSARFQEGPDFDAYSITYQYGWNTLLKKPSAIE